MIRQEFTAYIVSTMLTTFIGVVWAFGFPVLLGFTFMFHILSLRAALAIFFLAVTVSWIAIASTRRMRLVSREDEATPTTIEELGHNRYRINGTFIHAPDAVVALRRYRDKKKREFATIVMAAEEHERMKNA